MKTLTVRLPEELVAQIDAEAAARLVSRSDVVRARLTAAGTHGRRGTTPFDGIADLIGVVDGLPRTLSASRKASLEALAYGRKRPR